MNLDLSKFSIVIWGNDNYNTLGLMREFRSCSEELFLLVNRKKKYCATLSKYCKHYYIADSIEKGLEFLCNCTSPSDKKTLLITTSDILAENVDRFQQKLFKYYTFSFTKEPGYLSFVTDKYNMFLLAQKCGFNTPATHILSDINDIKKIDLPCFIKPLKSYESTLVGLRNKINDVNTLLSVIAAIADKSNAIIQQYVKKEYEILVYGCRLSDGSIFIPGSFKKTRWHGSNGSYGLISKEIPKIINIECIKSFLTEIGYYGLFSVEYGIENNTAFFYEINLRNDGTSHYFEQAGANIPLLYYKDIMGEPVNYNDYKVKKDTVFIDEIGDRSNIDGSKLTKKIWMKQFKAAKAYKLYDENDKLPYLWAFVNYMLTYTLSPIKNLHK